MANVDWDASDFLNKVSDWDKESQNKLRGAVNDVANEVLRLSQFQVPHDVGTLQSSGQVEPGEDYEAIVGYNTEYAAYQHEGIRADGTHPIRHWQGGRKGKYLEDPIRHNLDVFKNYFESVFEQ